jgi:Coenzyme PQQ synthesis protein D (PqqD)
MREREAGANAGCRTLLNQYRSQSGKRTGMQSSYEIIKPRTDLGVKKVDEDLLILDRKNDKIHQLNSMAHRIWTGLASGKSPTEIAQDIAGEFEIPFESAFADVSNTVEQLFSLGLLNSNEQD